MTPPIYFKLETRHLVSYKNDGGRMQSLAGRKDRGKRPTANARPGRGRIGLPCRNWGGRCPVDELSAICSTERIKLWLL